LAFALGIRYSVFLLIGSRVQRPWGLLIKNYAEVNELVQRPMKPCGWPGCPNLVRGQRYCEEHAKQKQKNQDERRGSFRQRGYTSNWDKVRKIKLSRDPLCERCESKGKVTAATLVHHRQSLSKGGSLADMDNLMSCCIKCHDEIHREQGDKW